MFVVQLYESPIGPESTLVLVRENMSEFWDRADAIRYAENYVSRFPHNGWDDQQDTWWGRGDDAVVQKLVIQPR